MRASSPSAACPSIHCNMKRLSVLVIAPADDLHAQAVLHILERLKVEAERVDLARLSCDLRISLILNGAPEVLLTTSSGRRISLSSVDTIWWRRPRHPDFDGGLDQETREFVRGEWEHFIASIESFTALRWVNPPAANRLAGHKGVQLVVAQSEGLRVPRTAITNNLETVLAWYAEGIPLIYKRVGPVPRPVTATKPLLETDLGRLDALGNCPAIFQEEIPAQLDIRVTVIGTELYGAEIESQSGASPLDWRFDHTVPFREHKLDSQVAARVRKIMARLGLVFGAIDLRLTPEGEYVFLEVNPNGQYLFVELLANIPLSEKMALYLAASNQ